MILVGTYVIATARWTVIDSDGPVTFRVDCALVELDECFGFLLGFKQHFRPTAVWAHHSIFRLHLLLTRTLFYRLNTGCG